jgi:hypothetical protein
MHCNKRSHFVAFVGAIGETNDLANSGAKSWTFTITNPCPNFHSFSLANHCSFSGTNSWSNCITDFFPYCSSNTGTNSSTNTG